MIEDVLETKWVWLYLRHWLGVYQCGQGSPACVATSKHGVHNTAACFIIIIIIVGSSSLVGHWPPQANVASDLYPGHPPAQFLPPIFLVSSSTPSIHLDFGHSCQFSNIILKPLPHNVGWNDFIFGWNSRQTGQWCRLLHRCWRTRPTFFVAFKHTGNEKASLRPFVHRALYEGVYNTLCLY